MIVKYLVIAMIGVFVIPASGELRPARHFTLNEVRLTQAIVRSLAREGIEIDRTRVSLLGKVLATEADPELDVRFIEAIGGTSPASANSRSAVVLTCRQIHACLPFYAVIDLHTETTGSGVSPLRSPLNEKAQSESASPNVIRTGARATLLLEDGLTHLQVSVISLENGPVGRTIRVRSLDHSRTYSAEIVSPSILRGRF